jgi:hypothetical protein
MDTETATARADEAGFVFVGRLVSGREVEAVAVPESAGTGVVVHVDRVLRGTEMARGLAGQDVTVATREPDALPADADVVIYARLVSVGRLALAAELEHEAATDDAVERATTAVRGVEERPLAERVRQADLVVSGEVVSHRPLDPDARPTSEHDPDLWVARVAVEEPLKGRSRRREVEVLYAHSMDIAWHLAPKLTPGTRGVFLLHATDRDDAPTFAAESRVAYQCTDPHDFQPADRASDVRRLAGAEGGES